MQRSSRIVVQSVLIAALVALFVPVGARAASQLVTLVDQDGNKAQIDSAKLRIGDGAGALTVDGAVNTRAAGNPFHREFSVTGHANGTFDTTPTYTVPARKRLVVTHVSGAIITDGVVHSVRLQSQHPATGDTITRLIPTPNPDVSNSYTFTQPLERAFPSGTTIRGNAFIVGGSGAVDRLDFEVSGYLVAQ